jgi:amino acid adenylation domain-containing protein
MSARPQADASGSASATPLGHLPVVDDRPAIVEPGRGSLSYAALDALAEHVARQLTALGHRAGGRIGLYTRRSSDAIAAMLGTLRTGGAYVPVDPRAPVDRNAEIHADCRVHAAFVEDRFVPAYRDALRRAGRPQVTILPLAPVGLGQALAGWAASPGVSQRIEQDDEATAPQGVACILYTSGTTGRPKGWMMSRAAIEIHAAWCHRLLAPSRTDAFANHAQFNFGMSLFDIYSSLRCGARLVLVPDEVRQHAPRLTDMLASERVSIWFSGPAILSLMGQLEDLRSRDLRALRVVAFAGEVFPWSQLNALRSRLPHPRYFNFYGSTETNVAAYHELPAGVALDAPPPLGRACEHYDARVMEPSGDPAPPGGAGELQLRGGDLVAGYWTQPALTAEKLIASADSGAPWFRTGDLVMSTPDGELRYAGRIGRMVKLRGYRVEPGEIEACLYQHPAVKEVGVVPVEGSMGLAVIELKTFCATKLPAYMIPERFEFHQSLPRTSTGKIDLQVLRTMGGSVVA